MGNIFQLMVNWRFGLVVGILWVPLSNNPFHKGIPTSPQKLREVFWNDNFNISSWSHPHSTVHLWGQVHPLAVVAVCAVAVPGDCMGVPWLAEVVVHPTICFSLFPIESLKAEFCFQLFQYDYQTLVFFWTCVSTCYKKITNSFRETRTLPEVLI